jgi:formate/nitrite transporter FocA (FNT family)
MVERIETPAKAPVPVLGGWAYRIAFSASVSAVMAILIGAVITFVRVPPGDRLVSWLQTAPLAFAAAFPTSLIIVPLIERALATLFTSSRDTGKDNQS